MMKLPILHTLVLVCAVTARNVPVNTPEYDTKEMPIPSIGTLMNPAAFLSAIPCLPTANVAIIKQCLANVTLPNLGGGFPDAFQGATAFSGFQGFPGSSVHEHLPAFSAPNFNFQDILFETGLCALQAMGAWNTTGGVNGTTRTVNASVIEKQVIKASKLTVDQQKTASNAFYTCAAFNESSSADVSAIAGVVSDAGASVSVMSVSSSSTSDGTMAGLGISVQSNGNTTLTTDSDEDSDSDEDGDEEMVGLMTLACAYKAMAHNSCTGNRVSGK